MAKLPGAKRSFDGSSSDGSDAGQVKLFSFFFIFFVYALILKNYALILKKYLFDNKNK